MKGLYPLVFSIVAGSWHGQVISSAKWQDVFSYNNVSHIREDNGKILAVAENGIFTYDTKSGEVSKYLSKVNGLHNVNITAFDYNPENKIGLVGYADGSLDIITDEGVTYIVDAPISTSYTGTKTIHHIHIQGNRAVISADYGVSIFNIDRKEYSETAFFPNPAKESVISNNKIYTIIQNEILAYDLSNLVGFNIRNNWVSLPVSGNFRHIASHNEILAISTTDTLYFGNEGNLKSINGFNDIRDININNDKIIVAGKTKIEVFDPNGNLLEEESISNQEVNTGWATAEKIFVGSRNGGLSDTKNTSYTPSGPYSNRATKISLLQDKIWVATGTRDNDYNEPIYTLPSLGFYFYNGSEWIYPSFFQNNNIYFNILDVVGNPSNYNQTFFANYSMRRGQGFYQLEYDDSKKDFNLKKYYSEEQNYTWLSRPVGFTYDENNNLFATSAFYEKKDGKMIPRYAVYSPSSDSFTYHNIEAINITGGIQKPTYNNGKLYIPLTRAPLFAIIDLNNTSTQLNDDNIQFLGNTNGVIDLYPYVLNISIDKNNELWIGHQNGLRVASTIPNNVSDTKVNPIIIEQKGLGEELFRDAQILSIEVDDSNYKWVSVNGGGVFYLSPNGQQTILHFTKENSPLPSNIVTDIQINKQTGKVYFVTQNGIVAYQSDVKNTNTNFGDVLVYPNPVVYAQHKGNVRIKGLAQKTFIRITDTAGNLVHQAEAKGGWYDWDLTHRGKRVASGIYFVLMTNEDGTDTATAKIAVIN